MRLKEYIPILQWLPDYQKKDLRGDLFAGLTVGIVVIPSGMAYGMLAGMPPIYGLYCAFIPMLLYAILGTSRHLIIGPAAIISILVAFGVGQLAEPSSERFIVLAFTLSLMVGVIQLALGVLRLGFLVNFLSHPVLSGFTSAASIIIFFSQLKHIIGVDIERTHLVHKIIWQAIQRAQDIHVITLLIGLGGVAIILGLRRLHKAIPGPLFAVIFGILIVYFANLHEDGVGIVGSIPAGLPKLMMPDLSPDTLLALMPTAFTIALIAILESIVIAKAIQRLYKDYQIVPNQEFRAVGIANIVGSFFQAYPPAGSFSRTAVNTDAGGNTGLSSLIASVIVGLTLIILTPLFYFLPKAILASIIMVAIVKLIDYKEAVFLWKSDRPDFYMLLTTFLATLFIGIEQGILIGILLSLVVVIYKSYRPNITLLGKIPGAPYYKNLERFPEVEQQEDILIIKFDGPMYFANVEEFRSTLQRYRIRSEDLKLIILNAEALTDLDSSALHTLKDMILEYQMENIDVYFSGVIGHVRDIMYKGGLTEKLGHTRFFLTVQHAVEAFHKGKAHRFERYTMQTNVHQPQSSHDKK